MSFTDKDLARLKEMLYHKCEGEDNPPPMPFDGSPFDKMKALLARLEASERCMKRFWKGHTKACLKSNNLSGGPSSCTCEMGDLYMQWEKAAGKLTDAEKQLEGLKNTRSSHGESNA